MCAVKNRIRNPDTDLEKQITCGARGCSVQAKHVLPDLTELPCLDRHLREGVFVGPPKWKMAFKGVFQFYFYVFVAGIPGAMS